MALCLRSLSCWKGTVSPECYFYLIYFFSRLKQVVSQYLPVFAPFIIPTSLTRCLVPTEKKHPRSIMLPPPYFTVGMVFSKEWAVLVLCHTQCFEFWLHFFSHLTTKPNTTLYLNHSRNYLMFFFSSVMASFQSPSHTGQLCAEFLILLAGAPSLQSPATGLCSSFSVIAVLIEAFLTSPFPALLWSF